MRLDLDWMLSLSKCFICPFFSAIFFNIPYPSAQSTVMLVLVGWMKRQLALCELFKHGCEEISIFLLRICNWGRGVGLQVMDSFFFSAPVKFFVSKTKNLYATQKHLCNKWGWLQCLDVWTRAKVEESYIHNVHNWTWSQPEPSSEVGCHCDRPPAG